MEGKPVSSESSHVDELSYMYMYIYLHVHVHVHVRVAG